MTPFSFRRDRRRTNRPTADRRRPLRLAGCFPLVFVGIGLLGTFAVAVEWLQGLQTWFWEETVCTIESSKAVARPELGDHVLDVSYRFTWGAVEQSGTRYRLHDSGSDEYEARMLASRYQPEAETPCWIDGGDPGRSVLRRSNLWEGLWIFVPLVFVAVGSGALWLLRSFPGPAGDGTSTEAEGANRRPGPLSLALPRDASPGQGLQVFKTVAFLVGFFGLFFLVGAGLFVPFFIWPALQVVEARSWEEVRCEILESGVRTYRGDESDTYSIEVLYRYEVSGREYLSNRYHFLSGSSSGYEEKARRAEEIPPGTVTTCYIDPGMPQQAVLERGFTSGFLFGVIPLLFVLVGAGGVYAVVAANRAARRAATGPSWLAPPVREDPARTRSAVTLEPKLGPVGKLLGTTLIAMVWNGLVSLFVWQLIESFRAGSPDWLLGLFLTPFVIIGLLLAAGIPYAVLALANPRPRLRLSREPLSPGESAQVEWSFRGRAGRIRRLAITLEAIRSRVTSRGSRSRTESESIASFEIVSRRRGHGLEYGAASFTLPEKVHFDLDGAGREIQAVELLDENSAASTDAGSGEMTWRLVLRGEIARWPDVHEEYALQVLSPTTRDESDPG